MVSKQIKVLTSDNKTTNIVSINVLTKTQRDIFNKIWNTITTKNGKILIGYIKENISKMKQKVKKIKQNKI